MYLFSPNLAAKFLLSALNVRLSCYDRHRIPQDLPVIFVEELPGANTQGNILEETRKNLEEAIKLVLEANRILAEEQLEGQEVIRESIFLSIKQSLKRYPNSQIFGVRIGRIGHRAVHCFGFRFTTASLLK
jgi:predicted RNase H-like HicB family nuclease